MGMSALWPNFVCGTWRYRSGASPRTSRHRTKKKKGQTVRDRNYLAADISLLRSAGGVRGVEIARRWIGRRCRLLQDGAVAAEMPFSGVVKSRSRQRVLMGLFAPLCAAFAGEDWNHWAVTMPRRTYGNAASSVTSFAKRRQRRRRT
jgi:hypothetical protein